MGAVVYGQTSLHNWFQGINYFAMYSFKPLNFETSCQSEATFDTWHTPGLEKEHHFW